MKQWYMLYVSLYSYHKLADQIIQKWTDVIVIKWIIIFLVTLDRNDI